MLACVRYVADDRRELESTAGKAMYIIPGHYFSRNHAYLIPFPLVLKSPDLSTD
jgi:hypothetical protein